MYKTNLKKLKEYLNINTLELSEKLEISYSTLGSYERGKRTPSVDFVVLLANKLNVNPNWFLTGIGNIFSNTECNTLKQRDNILITENISKLSERLSVIQEKNNLRDKDMAKILDMYQEDYIDFKQGSKEPTFKILNKLKQTFDISLDWLLYGK